jgi:hypothetical protein
MCHSYSGLETFKRCKEQWKKKYIDKIATEKSVAMERGIKMHETISGFTEDDSCRRIKRSSEPVTIPARLVGVPGFPYLMDIFSRHAEDELYPELMWAIKPDMSFCAFDDPQAWFRGVIDLVAVTDTEVVVYEYKTGTTEASVSQPQLYSMIAARLFPGKPVVAYMVYLERGDGILLIPQRSYSDIESELVAKAKEVEAEKVYAGTVGSHCYWCGYRAECNTYNNSRMTQYEVVDAASVLGI